MEDIQADSVKMNQEIETTQLNQSVRDSNIPHLVVGIKKELDNETKDDIQSQLPFLADKIKQEQISIKSEAINSFEDLYMKVRKVDSVDETITELEKEEQLGPCVEDMSMHIKNEMCASTWSSFTDTHTDVRRMESSGSGQHPQLVGHDTISEKLPEVIRKTEKDTEDVEEGLERLLVHVREIVKNTGDVADDLAEHMHFEMNTVFQAGSFEMMQIHTENTILKAKNKTGDLCLTSREQSLNNDSVKVRECQVIVEDIMAKITQNEGRLSLNNIEFRKLSDNAFCVSKKGIKCNVSSADSEKLSRYNVCGISFIRFGSLNIHKRKNRGEKPYECDVCGKGFSYISYLNAHKMIHTGEKPYKCDVCGKCFTNTSYLNAHKMIHTGEKPYKCDECGKGFTYSKNLYAHKRKHTGEKPYKCDVCDKGFTQNSSLDAHKRIHTGEKPYKCDICGKGFTHNSSLIAHKTVHTGEKPYKCDVCGKGFPNTSNLNTHKRIHTGEKPYECDICGKVFGYTSSLNTHQRIHTGEKPYKCDDCGQGFAETSNLSAHKLMHTGEKPYKCDVCGKGCTNTSNLKVHKRIHTGEKPYKCEFCSKRFIQQGHLRVHKRMHTDEKPYKCDICSKGFIQQGHLHVHKKKHM